MHCNVGACFIINLGSGQWIKWNCSWDIVREWLLCPNSLHVLPTVFKIIRNKRVEDIHVYIYECKILWSLYVCVYKIMMFFSQLLCAATLGRGECKDHFRMWSFVPKTLWTIFCSAPVPHGTLIKDREGYEGHLLILGFLPFSSCIYSSSCIQFIFQMLLVAVVNGWMFLTFSLYKDQIRCALLICYWIFFSKVFSVVCPHTHTHHCPRIMVDWEQISSK